MFPRPAVPASAEDATETERTPGIPPLAHVIGTFAKSGRTPNLFDGDRYRVWSEVCRRGIENHCQDLLSLNRPRQTVPVPRSGHGTRPGHLFPSYVSSRNHSIQTSVATATLAKCLDLGMNDAHVSGKRIIARKRLFLATHRTSNLRLATVVNSLLVTRKIVRSREDGVARLVRRRVDTRTFVWPSLRVARLDSGGSHACGRRCR